MTGKLSKADIYVALLNYARENELLIYTNTTIYFAIAVPLAGVALGAGDFGRDIQIFAASVGLLASVFWFLIVERCRRWFSFILKTTAEMELEDGYSNGRSTLYESLPDADTFIKYSPRSSTIMSGVFILGIILFIVLLAQNIAN